MTKIRTLDVHLSNMIAAGEVVERPAGIVKELVENALDATATQITVKIEEGGMTLIEVSDNGEGISRDEAALAFMRHSTSKIKDEEDLSRILSFGFRGEALPSIASVSVVELVSNDGISSYRYRVDHGLGGEIQSFPRNQGTTVTVRELFLRTPARLKFIKNPRYEARLVLDIVQKFAMSHPEVAFTYLNDNNLAFKSYGNHKALDVFHQIHGAEIAKNSRSFARKSYDFEVSGIAALAQHNRSHKNHIWINLNGRMIRYPKLANRVVASYQDYLAANRFPILVLNVKSDPHLVDVNVHPSKWEIRLSKEEDLLALVEAALLECLREKTETQSIRLPEAARLNPVQPDANIRLDFSEEKRIIREAAKPTWIARKEDHPEWLRKVDEEFKIETVREEAVQSEEIRSETKLSLFPELKILAQLGLKYILCEGEAGLYILDQHAAMERIRYEYFRKKLLGKIEGMQALLVPYVFEGRSDLIDLVDELNEKISSFHIRFEVLDKHTLIVRELPLWLKKEEALEFMNTLLDDYSADKDIYEEAFRHKTLATLACHSSVRFNMHLAAMEMKRLVEDLSQCENPYHCPHGRPTMIKVSYQDLIKDFMR